MALERQQRAVADVAVPNAMPSYSCSNGLVDVIQDIPLHVSYGSTDVRLGSPPGVDPSRRRRSAVGPECENVDFGRLVEQKPSLILNESCLVERLVDFFPVFPVIVSLYP